MGHNRYSKTVTQDSSQPAAQAMLHAIGLTEEDFQKLGIQQLITPQRRNGLSSLIGTIISKIQRL